MRKSVNREQGARCAHCKEEISVDEECVEDGVRFTQKWHVECEPAKRSARARRT